MKAGHEVQVVTHTLAGPAEVDGMPVHRRPRPGRLIQLHRWCDICLHQNITLTYSWPLLFVRKPWVIALHTIVDARYRFAVRLKTWCVRRFARIVVSRQLQAAKGYECTVVGNPVNPIATPIASVRSGLVFVGRLVSEKGVDVLLKALAKLSPSKRPRCTIVGDGPERAGLERAVAKSGLAASVTFTGFLEGEALWRCLSQHLVLAVPSQVDEGFGLVVLEGLACGCAVIASDRGGLPEAVGPCGILVPSDDVDAWTLAIQRLLSDESLRKGLLARAPEHLAKHEPAAVARQYLDIMAASAKLSPEP